MKSSTKLEKEMAFRVGDHVQVCGPGGTTAIVTERLIQECHGGAVSLYRIMVGPEFKVLTVPQLMLSYGYGKPPSSTLVGNMKFTIGDIVYFRGASHNRNQKPEPYCITERIVQEVHGGVVQQLYNLFGVSGWVPEIALQTEIPKFVPTSPEWLADNVIVTGRNQWPWSKAQGKEGKDDQHVSMTPPPST